MVKGGESEEGAGPAGGEAETRENTKDESSATADAAGGGYFLAE